MMSDNKGLGKYFFMRYMPNPSLVLEVQDGSTAAGTPVAVNDFSMQGTDSIDHQLWYFDRVLQTICSKLTGFGLHSNDNQRIIVRPCSRTDDRQQQQQWQIVDNHIKLKSQPELTVAVGTDDSTSGRAAGSLCRASIVPENNCWMIDRQPPFYLYINLLSNKDLVVDVRKADRKPGAKVIAYANKGDLADNQLWYEDENSILRSKLNGFACDASVGKEVCLSPYHLHNASQQWVIDGDFIRNVVQPATCLSIKEKCFLSSPCLYAENTSDSHADAQHRRWQFTYIPHQSASLSHSGCGKYFNICSHVGGFALQVEGKLIEPGTVVMTQVRERNTLRQQFCQDEITGTIRSALRNYCIDVDSSGLVVINPYDPHRKTQQWAIIGKQIQNRHNVNSVLQLSGTMDGAGSRVAIGEYVGKECQHWDICHVPARSFLVVSQMNGKVLDVKGDETSSGAALIVYERKSTWCLNQLWYEDETGMLRSKLNGYVIDTRNGTAALRPFDPSIKLQHWMIVGDRIQNRYDSNQVLDIYGNSSLSSKVGQYSFHGGENQRWKFEMV